jgi:hypothetical protein
MAAGQASQDRGVVDALQHDLRRFHEHWMALLYPRQVGAENTVLGKYRPQSTGGRAKYRLWGAVGAVVVGLLYPVVLFGAVVRYQARRIDAVGRWLGVLGVLVTAGVVWGALALAVRARAPISQEGFYAVVAAGSVATLSAVGALVFARVGGRKTTVLAAYPLGVTAFLLPPVVAALYSPVLARLVFPGTRSLAVWALQNLIPAVVANPLTATFDLVGVAYVVLWFAVAVPVGWLLGTLVALADVVRPT